MKNETKKEETPSWETNDKFSSLVTWLVVGAMILFMGIGLLYSFYWLASLDWEWDRTKIERLDREISLVDKKVSCWAAHGTVESSGLFGEDINCVFEKEK